MRKSTTIIPRIGEVYMMRFGGTGSEQGGWRPGVVFQNNTGNTYSPNIIALPLTSSLKKLNQPTHVLLPSNQTGLPRDSVVLCENPERMSKDRMGDYMVTLSDDMMAKIAEANLLATGAIAFIDQTMLIELRERAAYLNSKGA